MRCRFHQRRKFAGYYLASISSPRASLPPSPKISLSCYGVWCCLEVEKFPPTGLSSPSISFHPAATPRPVFVPHIWWLLHWLLFSGRVSHYPLVSSWCGPGMLPLHEGHTFTQFALQLPRDQSVKRHGRILMCPFCGQNLLNKIHVVFQEQEITFRFKVMKIRLLS